jgi:DNA-binding transcriptional ArsR family regulator
MNSQSLTSELDVLEPLRAIANPMRLQILGWLREPDVHFSRAAAIADPHEVGVCVSHIRAKAGLAQSTVSAYMAELERAGLVRATRVGKWTHYKRDEDAIRAFTDALQAALVAP